MHLPFPCRGLCLSVLAGIALTTPRVGAVLLGSSSLRSSSLKCNGDLPLWGWPASFSPDDFRKGGLLELCYTPNVGCSCSPEHEVVCSFPPGKWQLFLAFAPFCRFDCLCNPFGEDPQSRPGDGDLDSAVSAQTAGGSSVAGGSSMAGGSSVGSCDSNGRPLSQCREGGGDSGDRNSPTDTRPPLRWRHHRRCTGNACANATSCSGPCRCLADRPPTPGKAGARLYAPRCMMLSKRDEAERPCPCNGSYVSMACCTNPIVHEPPWMKLGELPQGYGMEGAGDERQELPQGASHPEAFS
ncbi:MAG: hypothetical protein M1832_003905 [Thelocarpon impressellum]|nr:MAG: hypothetical protein M1832_003905 [Thelocarpon impressellum]